MIIFNLDNKYDMSYQYAYVEWCMHEPVREEIWLNNNMQIDIINIYFSFSSFHVIWLPGNGASVMMKCLMANEGPS